MRTRRTRPGAPVFSRATWRGFTSLDTIPKAEMVSGIPVNYTGKPPIFLSIVYLGVCALNVAFVISIVDSAIRGAIGGIVASGILLLVFGGVLVLITFPMRRIWYFWLLVRRQRRQAASADSRS